jgi:hypothetical protein
LFLPSDFLLKENISIPILFFRLQLSQIYCSDLKIDEDDSGSVAGSSGKKERHFWQYNVQVSQVSPPLVVMT